MKNLYLLISVFVLLISTNTTFAQQLDSLWLDEVQVSATRIYLADEYQPITISRIDSLGIQMLSTQNIAEALEYFAPVTVRSNGPGGLSTISIRGYAPSQTQVLWNGFPLNHAMLGLTDLSIIPDFAVSAVSVAGGAANTGYGERGGGTLSLQTPRFKNKVGFSGRVGSFGALGSEMVAAVESGKWRLSTILGYREAENDFSYGRRVFSNEAGGFVRQEVRRENNALSAQTAIVDAGWKSKHRDFRSILWFHQQDNQIPGAVTGLNSRSRQDDAYFRWMNRYSTRLFNQKLKLHAFLNRQELNFFDPAQNLESLSTITQLHTDAELRSSLSRNVQTVSAIQLGTTSVDASEYVAGAHRTQASAQSTIIWHVLNPVYVYGSLRGDYYSDFGGATTYRLDFTTEILRERLFWKGQWSRGFIVPTFNDLYWPNLGDPNLDPEINQKLETGFSARFSHGQFRSETDATLYSDRVQNGIRWLPGSDGLSRPENIESLRLYGMEFKEKVSFSIQHFRLSGNLVVQRNIAEISEERFPGDRAVGKQLRYNPKWQYAATVSAGYRFVQTMLSYRYTGQRFSSSDHSSPLDPLGAFNVLNASLMANLNRGAFTFQPVLSVLNLLDERYAVIRGFPQPGRNAMIKISVTYNLK